MRLRLPVVDVAVRRVARGHENVGEDQVAAEEPLEIAVRRGEAEEPRVLSITLRTPGHDAELAVGFLFAEGVLRGPRDLVAVDLGDDGGGVTVTLAPDVVLDETRLDRHSVTTSACGACGKTSIAALALDEGGAVPKGGSVSAEGIHSLPGLLLKGQSAFAATGGIHAAGLFDVQGDPIALREDIGRHNAVDKLVGAEFSAGRVPFTEPRILMVSGRAGFELVQKARRAGITIFAAVGAPSSLAVEIARDAGMTLLGFVRDGRFNIYCGEERVGT